MESRILIEACSKSNKIVFLEGPNGCGKTFLVKQCFEKAQKLQKQLKATKRTLYILSTLELDCPRKMHEFYCLIHRRNMDQTVPVVVIDNCDELQANVLHLLGVWVDEQRNSKRAASWTEESHNSVIIVSASLKYNATIDKIKKSLGAAACIRLEAPLLDVKMKYISKKRPFLEAFEVENLARACPHFHSINIHLGKSFLEQNTLSTPSNAPSNAPLNAPLNALSSMSKTKKTTTCAINTQITCAQTKKVPVKDNLKSHSLLSENKKMVALQKRQKAINFHLESTSTTSQQRCKLMEERNKILLQLNSIKRKQQNDRKKDVFAKEWKLQDYSGLFANNIFDTVNFIRSSTDFRHVDPTWSLGFTTCPKKNKMNVIFKKKKLFVKLSETCQHPFECCFVEKKSNQKKKRLPESGAFLLDRFPTLDRDNLISMIHASLPHNCVQNRWYDLSREKQYKKLNKLSESMDLFIDADIVCWKNNSDSLHGNPNISKAFVDMAICCSPRLKSKPQFGAEQFYWKSNLFDSKEQHLIRDLRSLHMNSCSSLDLFLKLCLEFETNPNILQHNVFPRDWRHWDDEHQNKHNEYAHTFLAKISKLLSVSE